MVVDVGINVGVVTALGGGTVGISLLRGCLAGSVAVVFLFEDCGIFFRLDEVEDNVVGWGSGWFAGSDAVVVIVNVWVYDGLILMCLVSVVVGGITVSIIGVSSGSGGGIRLGFGSGESSSGIGVSCTIGGI